MVRVREPHRPSVLLQLFVDPRVTGDVPVDLVHPGLRTGGRVDETVWALVPEASVDEDGDPLPDENDVRSSNQLVLKPVSPCAVIVQQLPNLTFA